MVNPWKRYVKLSTVLMDSDVLTKGSLASLNSPAQIMFESTKLVWLLPCWSSRLLICFRMAPG
ncbi:hypothetical protein ACS0TY_015923 [Phlomoides rotata]